ncbi:kinase-like protein, partial [Viridothelium virens]
MSASDAISSDDLKGFLRKLLGSPLDDKDTAPRRLRNQDYQSISDYLQMAGKRSWADRPRTFTVLYMIDHVEAMDGFIAEDLSDIALPYSDGNLPNVFSKQARSQFLRYQSNVLDEVAADIAGDLEEGGQHRNLDGPAETYFRRVRRLGEGGFATVDEVVGNLSSKHFALKRMPRHTFFETDRSRLEAVKNELQSLKRLSHKHIVQLVGSFTDHEGIGLLMTPVAKQNLAEFMTARVDKDGQEDRRFLLRNFFGCIASAVDYLHSQNIRHKDIKPQNILVKDTKVYITDFGTSRMWIKDDTDTTEGTVSAFTQRYSAPEVIHSQKRNKSADIWSLGCVFLEMAVVLADRTLRDMKTFFLTNGSKREFVYSNPEALSLWIEELR